MKKCTILMLLSLLSFSFDTSYFKGITESERKMAVKQLKSAKSDLYKNVKSLSENQLTYKIDSTRWSVYECVQHIALAKNMLWQMFITSLKDPADPSKRSEVKVTDEAFTMMLLDRSKKNQAIEPLRPENSTFSNNAQALESYDAQTENIIKYVNKTEDDLRNHYVKFPFGTLDAYQMLLMIAGHDQRHIKQIEEVMADPKFPKF